MDNKQTDSSGSSLPLPLGARIERIMDDLLDIEYRSGCTARVQDMVHRDIVSLESARYAANTKGEARVARQEETHD